jgi:hypothetical protein
MLTRPPPGTPQRNFGDKAIPVTLQDICGREGDFSLDKDSFQTLDNVPDNKTDFASDDRIKQNYYPEVEQILFDHVPGCNRVFIFDHSTRSAEPTRKSATAHSLPSKTRRPSQRK